MRSRMVAVVLAAGLGLGLAAGPASARPTVEEVQYCDTRPKPAGCQKQLTHEASTFGKVALATKLALRNWF